MSIAALQLYEQLTEATDDKSRARVIAEAFGQLEERYPHLSDVATQGHLSETELRLQKEIEKIRLEIKEVEARLRKEIEHVRLEIREVEAGLRKEIHALDLKIAETTVKITEIKAELIRWVVAVGLLQTTLITGVLLKVAHLI